MCIKQNIGNIDRIFRFVLGIWILQMVLPVVSQPLWWWLLLILGVGALLESFSGYCWLHEKLISKNKR